MIIDGKIDDNIWNNAKEQLDIALQIDNQNPRVYLRLSYLYLMKWDLNRAYLYTRQALVIAPEYKYSYAFADNLLKRKYNIEFSNYLENMKKIWIDKPINN